MSKRTNAKAKGQRKIILRKSSKKTHLNIQVTEPTRFWVNQQSNLVYLVISSNEEEVLRNIEFLPLLNTNYDYITEHAAQNWGELENMSFNETCDHFTKLLRTMFKTFSTPLPPSYIKGSQIWEKHLSEFKSFKNKEQKNYTVGKIYFNQSNL